MYEAVIGELVIPKNSLMQCHTRACIKPMATDHDQNYPITTGLDFDGEHPTLTRVIREHKTRRDLYFTDTCYVILGKEATCCYSRIRNNYDRWESFISPLGLQDLGLVDNPTSESLYDLLGVGSKTKLTPWMSEHEASDVILDVLSDRIQENITVEEQFFDDISPRIKRDLVVGTSSSRVMSLERHTRSLDVRPTEFQSKESSKWNRVTDKYLVPEGCDLAVNDLNVFSSIIPTLLSSPITDMDLTARIRDIFNEESSLFGGAGYVLDRFQEKCGEFADHLYNDCKELFTGAAYCYIDAQGMNREQYVCAPTSSLIMNNNTINIRKTFAGMASIVISDAVLKVRTCYLFDINSILLASNSMVSWGH